MTALVTLLQPLMFLEELVLEGLHAIGLAWGLAIVGLPCSCGWRCFRSRCARRAPRRMARRTPRRSGR